MFLLIVEGLSRLIGNAKTICMLKGVKITPSETISHLLFIDDILFGADSPQEFQALKDIMDLYCHVTSMEINMTKSNLLFNFPQEDL
jgi:hypothetical protein